MRFAALFGAVNSPGSLAYLVIFQSGPFSGIGSPLAEALSVEGYMFLATAMATALSAMMGERARIVSELRRSEGRHRAQAARLGAITRTIPDGLMVVDRGGRIRLHNNAAADFMHTGAADGDTLGSDAFVAFDADNVPIPADQRPSVRALAGETVTDQAMVIVDLGAIPDPRPGSSIPTPTRTPRPRRKPADVTAPTRSFPRRWQTGSGSPRPRTSASIGPDLRRRLARVNNRGTIARISSWRSPHAPRQSTMIA